MNKSSDSEPIVLIFRMALAAYIALTLFVAVKVFFLASNALPDAARFYMAWLAQQPTEAIEDAAGWLSLVAAFVSVVSSVAMVQFARWGRPVFVVAIAGLIVSEAMISLPVIKTPGEYLADTVLGVLAGGIMVLSYCRELSDRFHRPSTPLSE